MKLTVKQLEVLKFMTNPDREHVFMHYNTRVLKKLLELELVEFYSLEGSLGMHGIRPLRISYKGKYVLEQHN